MTKLQAIREFMTFVCGQPLTIARNRFNENNFAIGITGKNPRLKLPRELDMKPDEGDKLFRENFVEQYPSAKGFSNITLTLLHECGHWMTRSVMDIVEYDKDIRLAYTQELYMMNPWEILATQWAICWLHSPSNRKIAKDFERKYFGY